MTQPQILTLSAVYEGTTWEGINSVTLEQTGGGPLNLTNAQLRMVYRRFRMALLSGEVETSPPPHARGGWCDPPVPDGFAIRGS